MLKHQLSLILFVDHAKEKSGMPMKHIYFYEEQSSKATIQL